MMPRPVVRQNRENSTPAGNCDDKKMAVVGFFDALRWRGALSEEAQIPAPFPPFRAT
jgi:hypothetical protein